MDDDVTIICKQGSDRFQLDDAFASCGDQLAGASLYCECPALQADPDIAGIGVSVPA